MPKETARGAGAAKKSADLSARQNGRGSTEKISTRGGERPAEAVSGDMMALRPVGATIGPANLARRAAPRSGRFATRPARPVGRSRGVPRGLTAEPEVVSRTRRPRTRRGGTTPSAVSTRRRPRSAKSIFGRVAENAVPRSIFFLAWLTRDFAQNFRDARSGRDLATINRRAPWRPAATEELERKRLRSAIVPRTPSSRHPARRFARARRPSAGPRVA